MPTKFEFRNYKYRFPWYKRIFFPLLLSSSEFDEFITYFSQPYTLLDTARDYAYECFIRMKNEKPGTFSYNRASEELSRLSHLIESYREDEMLSKMNEDERNEYLNHRHHNIMNDHNIPEWVYIP